MRTRWWTAWALVVLLLVAGGAAAQKDKGGGKPDPGEKAPPPGKGPDARPPKEEKPEPAQAPSPPPEEGAPEDKRPPETPAEDKGTPEDAGKPEGLGKPDDAGKPEGVGKPEGAGKPEGVGKPDDAGPPDDRGKKDKEDPARGKDRDASAPREGRPRTRDTGAVALERASVDDAPAPAAVSRAVVRVVRAGEPVDVARGLVHVAPERASERAHVVLVHPNGTEEPLGPATSERPWNTSRYENGYYAIEVRETTEDGGTMTLASTRILVENPRASAVEAVAAVATGALVTAGASAVATRGVDLLGFLKQSVFEVGGEVAEDRVQRKTTWGRDRRTRSLLLIGLAGLFLAFFRVFADRASFDGLILALPVALLAVFLCTIATYAAEWGLARGSGAQARFRFWLPGAVSLAASALVFRSAFGYPGYIEEGAAKHVDARRAGLRALALLLVGFAIAMPFLVVGHLWVWSFAEYGAGVALMMTAASAMPLSPMPGREVWAWSKAAWAGIFGVAAGAYVLWELAAAPTPWLLGLGCAGLLGYAMVSGSLAKARVDAGRAAAP